jgi:uncharacterized membrane protein
MSGAVLVLAVFLACAVEAVEALTVVLAVGLTRGWRSALLGAGAAALSLAVITAALGPTLLVIPIDALRLVVGGLLLTFGLQWLRKAILRASGHKSRHDEEAVFAAEVAQARQASPSARAVDWYSFTLAFKAVLLEGLEVVFIVLSFGSNEGRLLLAAGGAVAAVVVVTGSGALVRHPLSKVPENTLKFAVGVMLTAFGTFWGAEGAGASWPGNDAALLAVVPSVAAFSAALTFVAARLPGGRRGRDERAMAGLIP